MVCVAGKPVSEGGCGTENSKAWGFDEDGNKVEIEIKQENPTDKDYNKLIFFTDTLTGTPPKGDHQFTHGEWHNKDYWDTVYAVRGGEEGVSSTITVIDRCLVADEINTNSASCTARATCPTGYKVAKCYGSGRGQRNTIGSGTCSPVIANAALGFFQGSYPLFLRRSL